LPFIREEKHQNALMEKADDGVIFALFAYTPIYCFCPGFFG